MNELKITDESDKITLQLGDIIEINAPSDPDIHNHVYYIKYLNNNKIYLVEKNGKEITLLMDEIGNLNNESILGFTILSRSDYPGYAKQKGLDTGKWVDVYFSGDVPFSMTGKITNMEEDMIEITSFPDKEIIYIDFGYKGIPEDIPIEKIILRTPPDDISVDIPSMKDIAIDNVFGETPQSQPDSQVPLTMILPELPTFVFEDGDIDEFQEEDIQSGQIQEKIQDLIFGADQIKFGDELTEITQVVEVSLSEQRFGIEKQTQDLLDDLLSSIPNLERTELVLNNIHKLIERFKELRTMYSKFDEQGNALMPTIKGANYKPLVESLQKFNQKLHWLLPVVKNKKKLYQENDGDDDITENDEGANDDYILTSLGNVRKQEQEIINRYNEGSFPESDNKYSYLMNALNETLTPFDEPTNKENYLITTDVNANINTIVDNLEDFYSSVAIYSTKNKSSFIVRKRFLTQVYNTGLDTIEMSKVRGSGDIVNRKQLTPNDTLTLKSLLTLPEPVVRFSRVNLPSTDIFIKSNLNRNYLNYWKLLNRKTVVSTKVIDNLDMQIDYDETTFVNDVKEYILDETIKDNDKYKKYLDIVIPKTRVLFNIMKPYIKDKLSVYAVLSYLEPFLIYQKDLSFMQYEEITNFIKSKIIDIKKQYIKDSRYFNTINQSKITFDLTELLQILNINDEFRKEIFIDGYEFENMYPSMSVSEFMKKINEDDNGIMFNTAIAMLSNRLLLSNIETDEIAKNIDEHMKNTNNEYKTDKNNCREIKQLAKRYIEIDELEDDNGSDKEVFFDKMYDNTYYSIVDEYRDKLNTQFKTLEERIDFLSTMLIKKNGIIPKEANRDARAMIVGKRRVEDGDYAALVIANERNITTDALSMFYYKRINGVWILQKDISNDFFIDTKTKTVCNLLTECIYDNKNKQCDTMGNEEIQLKNRVLSESLNEFETSLYKNNDKLIELLENKKVEVLKRLKIIRIIHYNDKLKYDRQQYMLGNTAKEVDIQESPYTKLRDIILGQADFAKRQLDISKFVLNYTRKADEGDNKYWLYCIKTHTKLLPTFIYKLSKTFMSNNNYKNMIELLCTEQGTLSDDGDAWVDKHSGYIIRKIDLDVSDEYTEEGFKSITRAVLEEDLSDSIIQEPKTQNEFINPDATKIVKVVKTMSGFMGINIENKHEFIIRNVIKEQGSSMPSKTDYEKAIQSASTKSKKAIDKYDSYEKTYDASLMFLSLSYYLVAIQISIPLVKTRKTHPGCVKSFMGFPIEGSEDMSGMTYVACVASKMEKRSIEPWNSIAKLKEKDILKRMEAIIVKYVLKNEEVIKLIKEKKDYLLMNKETDVIPEEHDIVKWINFLPPLRELTMKPIQNISKEFETELIDSMRTKSKKQDMMIQVIKGKIIYFSMGIQEMIQTVVNKKSAILTNSNSEPFLENACCDNNETNTLNYFIKEQPDISNYNNKVKQLGDIYNDIIQMGKSPILFEPRDTRRKYIKLPIGFSEDTIYRAFIVLCKYNSELPISDELKAICMNKPTNLDYSDSMEENIKKLKSDGKLFNNASLQQLLRIVNKTNSVNFKITRPSIHANVNVLKDILNSLNDRDIENIPKQFINKFLEMIDTDKVDINGIFEDTMEMRAFKNYLGTINEKMENDIIAIMNKSSKMKKNELNMFIEQFRTIIIFKETGNNTFIESEDETIYKMVQFIKNALRDITRVFPNMILNKVEYDNDTVIPKHWDLSEKHVGDIRKTLINRYSSLYQFYHDTDIKLVAKKILSLTRDMELLVNNTMFFSPLKIGEDKYIYSVFDRRLTMLLFKFYFYNVFTDIISLKEDSDILLKTIVKPLTSKIVSDQLDNYIQSQEPITTDINVDTGNISELEIVLGEKMELMDKLVNLIAVFTGIIYIDKKTIDFNYKTLMERVMRSKEREKDIITTNFKKMTDEKREVQNLFKNHRLGDWNKGMQKGLVKYQKDTYDAERNDMDLYDSVVDTVIDGNHDHTDILLGEETLKDADINEFEDNNIEYMGEDADYQEMGLDGDEQY